MKLPLISFRSFDHTSDLDCSLMAKWENDPEIRDLFQVFPTEESASCVATVDMVSRGYAPSEDNPTEQSFMILLEDIPVGEMNFFIDRKPILTPKRNTAWVGIVIGESYARKRGVGKIAMLELERRAKEAGAEQIELGVFEHNKHAILFYQKLGYKEFARLPDYTYAKGKKWADIRMVKTLCNL